MNLHVLTFTYFSNSYIFIVQHLITYQSTHFLKATHHIAQQFVTNY